MAIVCQEIITNQSTPKPLSEPSPYIPYHRSPSPEAPGKFQMVFLRYIQKKKQQPTISFFFTIQINMCPYPKVKRETLNH